MGLKSIVTFILLLFVISGLIYALVREGRKTLYANSDGKVVTLGGQKGDEGVVVYYFHGTGRCPSCKVIEAYTKEAVFEGFKDEVNRGQVKFEAINVEEPQNEHFIRDYNLVTRSVVVARRGTASNYKNLDEVWKRLHSKEEFLAYVQGEIRAFLDKGGV